MGGGLPSHQHAGSPWGVRPLSCPILLQGSEALGAPSTAREQGEATQEPPGSPRKASLQAARARNKMYMREKLRCLMVPTR